MFRKMLLTAAVAVAVGVLSPSAAKADFELTLSSGATSYTIDFSSATSGFGTGAGAGLSWSLSGTTEVVSGTFAGYSLLTQTNKTNSPGNTVSGTLSLGNVSVTNNTGNGSLTFTLTATGYSAPNPQTLLQASDSATSSGSGNSATVTGTAYYSSTGGTGDESGPNVPLSSFSVNNGASGSSNGMIGLGSVPSSSYSITDVFSLTNIVGEVDSAGMAADVYGAPAPGGLLLAATVVPFIGVLRRRMRDRKSVV